MSQDPVEYLVKQMQALESYLTSVSQKMGEVSNILRDTIATNQAIKALEQNTESETLIPLGTGAFIQVKLEPNTKFIMKVSEGVLIEKDSLAAQNQLEKLTKEIEIMLQNLEAERQNAIKQLEQGNIQMRQLLASEKKSR